MPETRYHRVETYNQGGKVVNTELLPYQVSDEELAQEEAGSTIAQLSALTDQELTPPLVGKFLKALAKLGRPL